MGCYPKAISETIDRLKDKIARVEQMEDALLVAEDIVAARCAGQDHKDDYISIGVDAYSLQGVLVMLHIDHFDEIAPILRSFALRGHNQRKGSKPDDYGEMQRRTYRLEGGIIVSFFFVGDVCKFVPTGEKKTEDVYELKCEGGEDL